MDIEGVATIAVDCGFRIHRDLGPGLLESVYEAVLADRLRRSGLAVERQRPISFSYEGVVFNEGFRADLLVEGALIIELKSVERLAPVHGKQLLTYLRLAGQPLGLLMNFGAETFKEGLRARREQPLGLRVFAPSRASPPHRRATELSFSQGLIPVGRIHQGDGSGGQRSPACRGGSARSRPWRRGRGPGSPHDRRAEAVGRIPSVRPGPDAVVGDHHAPVGAAEGAIHHHHARRAVRPGNA